MNLDPQDFMDLHAPGFELNMDDTGNTEHDTITTTSLCSVVPSHFRNIIFPSKWMMLLLKILALVS